MCGVAGIWHRDAAPVDVVALEKMGTILAHRGPDGFGTLIRGEVGLVNRRLRILDPRESADQPMSLPGRGLWLTFNGEIHNYLELRRELESRGAEFRTHSDTEVVLWAYAIWSTGCFERFNGMWALAIWDAKARELVLCRDRFGIKPLCYSARGDRVCFASEAKAILAAFPEERRPDAEEIQHFLAGGYPDAGERTFFENVKSVVPSTFVSFRRSGSRETNYWKFVAGTEGPRSGVVAEFRELLADAVSLRARSDVPIGACLSGGLDSSAVVGLLARAKREPVPCFSTRYDEPAYDESDYAALMAKRQGLVMHWVRPSPRDMVETMRRIVWHHDAPTPMRGRLAQWFVMQEVGRHVKVVLEGHGSDELLGGYGGDVFPYLIDRIKLGGNTARDFVREVSELGRVGSSLHWFLLTAAGHYFRDPRARRAKPYESALNNVLWSGLRHDGLPESLHSDDALSMAFSVESRPPFLDHRLVEFCFSLPFFEKISDGWTKSLLRRSMTDVIPREILERRRKFGFLAPVTSWLRLDDNRRAVRDLLCDRTSLERGLIDGRRLRLELEAFHHGPFRYARMRTLHMWRLITLELWFREFVDGDGLRLNSGPAGGSVAPFPRDPAGGQ